MLQVGPESVEKSTGSGSASLVIRGILRSEGINLTYKRRRQFHAWVSERGAGREGTGSTKRCRWRPRPDSVARPPCCSSSPPGCSIYTHRNCLNEVDTSWKYLLTPDCHRRKYLMLHTLNRVKGSPIGPASSPAVSASVRRGQRWTTWNSDSNGLRQKIQRCADNFV